jgi:hypothetical protein
MRWLAYVEKNAAAFANGQRPPVARTRQQHLQAQALRSSSAGL